MFLAVLSECGPSAVLKVLLFLKEILDIIFIIVPIGLIIMISIDFAKAVIASDPDNMKKVSSIAINRLLYAVILFAVPWIVSSFITLLGGLGVDSVSCLTTVDIDTINALEAEEKEREEIEKTAGMMARQVKLAEMQLEEEAKKMAEEIVQSMPKLNICDGVIYYENGTFYKPQRGSTLVPKNGVKETMGSGPFGYNKYFYELLLKFQEAAKKENHTIIVPEDYVKGWRPYEQQQYFWCCYKGEGAPFTNPYTNYTCEGKNTCNVGSNGIANEAAEPGHSNHGWGVASDLQFNDFETKKWAHENAEEYNLKFSECKELGVDCREDWHIEPLSLIADDEKIKKCIKK